MTWVHTVIFPVLDRFSILVPYVPQKRYIWISFVVIYKALSYQQIYSKQTFFRFQTCLHRWKCKHVWFSQFWMIFPVPDGFLKEAQNRDLKVRKCQFCRISIFYIYSFKLFILKVSKWPFKLFILSFTCALSHQWMKSCMVEWFSYGETMLSLKCYNFITISNRTFVYISFQTRNITLLHYI